MHIALTVALDARISDDHQSARITSLGPAGQRRRSDAPCMSHAVLSLHYVVADRQESLTC